MTKVDAKNDTVAPLRVVYVVAPAFGYSFSGITKPIIRLLREWDDPDIELSIWGSDYLIQSTDNELPLWSKTIRHTRRVRFQWTLKLLWMMIRYRKDYDVIHSYVLWWGGLLAPLLARLLGKRAIYHMTLLGSDNPSNLGAQKHGALKLALFRQYHGHIGLSPALIEDCRHNNLTSQLFVLPGFITFFPGTSPDHIRRRYARQQLAIPQDAQTLIFVGSAVARKGIDLLIDLFLKTTSNRSNLRLLIVGAASHSENKNVDDQFIGAQEEKLTQAAVTGRVIWTGLISDEETLTDYYTASDIFVFPTRAEGQGYVILEAMGCGLPVVCSNLPGVTDTMVVQDETGYLVDVDDVEGFVNAVERLLDDHDLRRNMGLAGRERALTHFSFDDYCHKLAAFYRLVASSDSSSDS